MHQILATEGVVLGKRPLGEANTLIFLFTKEAGLLKVSARSARLSRSKLRYGLEPLTVGRYALVRGRHEWKLTGTGRLSRELFDTPPERRRALGRIAKLLLRLIHGEEQVGELYGVALAGFEALVAVPESDVEHVECLLVLRILAHLGYVPDRPEIAGLLGQFFGAEVLREVEEHRPRIIRTINESLSATGL